MPKIITAGAMMQCSFGVAPSALVLTPDIPTYATIPAATIMDNIPLKNIPPFGMCTTQSNPTVAAATAAALGVPTPAPCMPVIPAPWAPGCPKIVINNIPALTETCKCQCAWGGVIGFTNPGLTKVGRTVIEIG